MLSQLSFIQLKTHVLLPITLFLIAGILWHAAQNSVLLPLMVITASVAIIMVTKKNVQRRLIRVAYFGCAFLVGSSLHQYQQSNHTAFQLNVCESALDIKGSINSIEKSGQTFMNCIVTIDATMMRKNTENEIWQTIAKTFHLYTRKQPTFLVGDYVQINNITLKKPNNDSFNAYLIKNVWVL